MGKYRLPFSYIICNNY